MSDERTRHRARGDRRAARRITSYVGEAILFLLLLAITASAQRQVTDLRGLNSQLQTQLQGYHSESGAKLDKLLQGEQQIDAELRALAQHQQGG